MSTQGAVRERDTIGDITGARVLVELGDAVTTDHISPAGAIPPHTPAGEAGPATCSAGWTSTVTVLADGRSFETTVRLDTRRGAEHYRHGGIMQFVLRNLVEGAAAAPCDHEEPA